MLLESSVFYNEETLKLLSVLNEYIKKITKSAQLGRNVYFVSGSSKVIKNQFLVRL